MQPFDALSIRAVLQEAKPLLLNRKVDKVLQLARDEILINLRSKAGFVSLFLSAQSVYGRMCIVRIPSSKDTRDIKPNEKSVFERYKSKYGNNTPPNFCVVLRKHLTGATLVGCDQIPGERIVDFAFSCHDAVGSTSLKVLTAEIMGRHSNLIFWDKESKKILAASHSVTKEMSRQREVLQNIPYERPPGQDRPNIFLCEEKLITEAIDKLLDDKDKSSSDKSATEEEKPDVVSGQKGKLNFQPVTLEQWLLSRFTGLGKHLSEEVIFGTGLKSALKEISTEESPKEKLIEKIKELRNLTEYSPCMQNDLSRYSLLGWHKEKEEDNWQSFSTVNELIENYFRSLEAREHYIQLREKIKAEINAEKVKLETRKSFAESHLSDQKDLDFMKTSGDMILANLNQIKPGQQTLSVDNWMSDNGEKLEIKLNPDITSVQNAQSYYRKYAKGRARAQAAGKTISEISKRIEILAQLESKLTNAEDIHGLRKIKETLLGKKHHVQKKSGQPREHKKTKPKFRLATLTSSDGFTIYVGRNRNENDHLISRIARPNDLWFHVSGQGGAHVLIRVPSTKQDPPKGTIEEAAQVAARLSKAGFGTKVRVIFTRCKHVKKVDKKRPGLVRYEQEKSVEVDTAKPMPRLMKKLFN